MKIIKEIKTRYKIVGLKEKREKIGLTQVHLAEDLGISKTYLNMIENGKRLLPEPLLPKLKEILSF